MNKLAERLISRWKVQSVRIVTAESCTGGLIAHELTNIPGASETVFGGLVTYQDEAKSAVLEIPAELLARHGAVSREVAQAMAESALALCVRATGAKRAIAVSTTGIAGPAGGTREKPVGLCFIGIASSGGETRVHEASAPRGLTRERNKAFFTARALELLGEVSEAP
ncbi:MAG: CinA family protein [Bdellovibrionota bacterium]